MAQLLVGGSALTATGAAPWANDPGRLITSGRTLHPNVLSGAAMERQACCLKVARLKLPGLSALTAKSAHRVTGLASLILLADIGDQRLRALHLNFEGGDQRIPRRLHFPPWRIHHRGNPVCATKRRKGKADT